MLEKLKEKVLEANLELVKKELVVYTWGNVSGFDSEQELIVIKPSGVKYEKLTLDKMVVLNLAGEVVEGQLKPSSDTDTHLILYRSFSDIGAVVHTHSPWATAWAQARAGIPCLGTTHADHFYDEIPCTRMMTSAEINKDYELNTGKVIVDRFKKINHNHTPGVLVAGHGPFTWAETPTGAVKNSVILEEIAKIASRTLGIKDKERFFARNYSLPDVLMDKHFLRKHGKNAYYGQSRGRL